jgi:hypothetical protein
MSLFSEARCRYFATTAMSASAGVAILETTAARRGFPLQLVTTLQQSPREKFSPTGSVRSRQLLPLNACECE